MTDSLDEIARKFERLIPCFIKSESLGYYLPTKKDAEFIGLRLEAMSLLDEFFGVENRYARQIEETIRSGVHYLTGGPSMATIEAVVQIIDSASRTTLRSASRVEKALGNSKGPYISTSRIVELRALESRSWDFSRLIELCRELNCAVENNCHMATTMLSRAILDHIPPIFGMQNFTQFANNYGSPRNNKSFKGLMQRLDSALRSVADSHLHTQIRKKESLPTENQVRFAAELDALLGEIIRYTQEKASSPTEE